MKRTIPFLAALGLLVGLSACTKGSVSGTITDGITKSGVEGVRVLARAESPDLTCQVFETTTDASGNFTIEGLCANATYTLSAGDESRFLTGTLEAEGGQPTTGVALTSWTAPEGSGVYILDTAGELTPQRTRTDVNKATLLDTEKEVRYPAARFKQLTPVYDGTYLVLVGSDTIANQHLHPLIESPEVKFAPDREDITHFTLGGPWQYIGVQIGEDGAHTDVALELDASKVISAESGERSVNYIPASALPAGDYAMLTDKGKRMFLFTFGGAEPAADAPADAPADDAPAPE